MKEKVKLQQDATDKKTVYIDEDALEYQASIFFHWRGATKYHKSIKDRVFAQGTSAFDAFIEYLSKQGY